MDKETAFQLIRQYTDGWKENNLDQIIGSLHKNTVIIESHGPTYDRLDSVRRWFELWLNAGNRVLQWDITSLYFCDFQEVVFCEWNFAFLSSDIRHAFSGASIVKFNENKISFLQEYRMAKQPYRWDRINLNAE